MDKLDNTSKWWIWFTVALVMFTCFGLGILMVGGSIYYLECQRDTGQVNCIITTKFLGTFNTEKRAALDVTGVVEAKDCEQDDCRYRIELSTSAGNVPLSNDFSPESYTEALTQIDAFLADSSQQTLQIQVLFWRMIIISVVYSLLGAIGLGWSLFRLKGLPKGKKIWAEVILPGEGKAQEHPDLLTLPEDLRMEREPSGLRFSYRHASWNGLLWLAFGVVFLAIGWLFLNPGEPFIKTAVMFIFVLLGGGDLKSVNEQGSYTVAALILIPLGVIMIYVGLAALINRLSIQVTYSMLNVRQSPLPYLRSHRLPSNQIKQLYVTRREVTSRKRTDKFGVLEAVLRDNSRVSLVAELPYNVLHYIEVQIESWLGLEDRKVIGEMIPEPSPEDLTKTDAEGSGEREIPQTKPSRSYPRTAAAVAVGTLILPGFCLSVGIFTYLVELPWCPPELAQDSGLGEVFAIPGIIYIPFASLLSGLLGFFLFRISRSLLKTANPMLLAITSGLLSGLVFTVLYPVLLTMLLCTW